MKRRSAKARRSDARPRPLRRHLLTLVVAALLPLLAFSAVMVIRLAADERRMFERGASDRTLALLTAVDTELKRSIAGLETLAASHNLLVDDHDGFHKEAERVLGIRHEWLTITLALPSRHQVVNALRPAGTALQPSEDAATFEEALRSSRAAIGGLIRERITRQHAFPIRVPVHRDGQVAYVLSALVEPDVIARLLAPQGMPRHWDAVVLDGRGTIVARTRDGSASVGRPGAAPLLAALERSPTGWAHGEGADGEMLYSAYARSAFSGWTVAIGVPGEEVEATFRQALAYLVAFALGLSTLGFGLAWLFSRRSATALTRLAERAARLGKPGPRPEPLVPGGSGVREIEALREAFEEAARVIEARSLEHDRVVESLQRVEAALRESDRRKDDFLAMLGHELRNPLGIISTASRLLRNKSPDDPASDELQRTMMRQVEHMTRLLDDLLDVSRIARGRIKTVREPCELVAIVRDTVEDHRYMLEAGGLRVDLELPAEALWVSGDRTRLCQAVGNLLQNAGKFTPAGGQVRVAVTADSAQGEAVVAVADNGAGMDAEALAHAFEPFRQSDRTLDRSRGGLGLGLALVKGLVGLHDGRVEVASEGIDRGTTFTIRLPLHDAAGEVALPAAEPAARTARPRSILVVEDNVTAARGLSLFLGQRGHAVRVAHDGERGIADAMRIRPEVVLCDIGLPGADGYTVARTLRADPRFADTLLVSITGYGQSIDRQRSKDAGFDAHLTKPIDLAALERLLESDRPARPPA